MHLSLLANRTGEAGEYEIYDLFLAAFLLQKSKQGTNGKYANIATVGTVWRAVNSQGN